jgi:hypothetical protein
MIARTWHGWTKTENASAYLAYLEKTGLKSFRDEPGNVAALTLVREHEDRSHFLVISIWEGIEAVRGFAGDRPDRAVFYPEDDRFLIDRHDHVDHYSLVYAGGALAEVEPRNHDASRSRARDWVKFAVGLR